MKCFVPFCNEAVESVANQMMSYVGPSYLRLGFGLAPTKINSFQRYEAIQKLCSGDKLTVIGMGPVLLNALSALEKMKVSADVFSVNELPLTDLASSIEESIRKTKRVLIIEEHVARGGLGEHLAIFLVRKNLNVSWFKHLFALGYPSGLYGNQTFHQSESGLTSDAIGNQLLSL